MEGETSDLVVVHGVFASYNLMYTSRDFFPSRLLASMVGSVMGLVFVVLTFFLV